MKNLIRKILKESVGKNLIKYYGKLSDKDREWLIRKGRKSYSGGELRPIFFNDSMIGGISWNLGGIDYIEFLPKYKDKGYLKYLVYDNMDKNGEVKFVTASDELTKKLSNYGNIDYDQNTDITSVTLNKDYLKESFNGETYSGNYVNKHIIDITPHKDDLPHFFMKNIIKPRKFKLVEISLLDLLDSDPSFREYYESGDERYDVDDINPDDLDFELVIVDGELLDGYSRASTLLRNGVNNTMSFVSI